MTIPVQAVLADMVMAGDQDHLPPLFLAGIDEKIYGLPSALLVILDQDVVEGKRHVFRTFFGVDRIGDRQAKRQIDLVDLAIAEIIVRLELMGHLIFDLHIKVIRDAERLMVETCQPGQIFRGLVVDNRAKGLPHLIIRLRNHLNGEIDASDLALTSGQFFLDFKHFPLNVHWQATVLVQLRQLGRQSTQLHVARLQGLLAHRLIRPELQHFCVAEPDLQFVRIA